MIYKKILKGEIPDPKVNGKAHLSKEARHLIERLLARDPKERLGCMKHGPEDVKTHTFFGKINWRRLEKKLLQAPYLPQIRGPMDASNFAPDAESAANTFLDEHRSANTPEMAHVFDEW